MKIQLLDWPKDPQKQYLTPQFLRKFILKSHIKYNSGLICRIYLNKHSDELQALFLIGVNGAKNVGGVLLIFFNSFSKKKKEG